jgi:hypothetical protein
MDHTKRISPTQSTVFVVELENDDCIARVGIAQGIAHHWGFDIFLFFSQSTQSTQRTPRVTGKRGKQG